MSASGTPIASTPTPVAADSIVIDLDGLSTMHAGEAATYDYDDPEPMLAFIEEVTGVPRAGEDVLDPWGNGDVWGKSYRWDDITVTVLLDGPAHVTVESPTIGDAPVTVAGGVAVGSTRAEAVAAGAWDDWDADGDGVADSLGIDERPVEDTQSLSRPGEVGRQYVALRLTGDTVTAIASPDNDFSDI